MQMTRRTVFINLVGLLAGTFLPGLARAGGGNPLNQKLRAAIKKADSAAIRALIKQGADVNTDSDGVTALVQLSAVGDLPSVQDLLKRRAEVNPKGKKSVSALVSATRNRHTAVVGLLLEHGANPNYPDLLGRSPLQWAAGQGDPAIVKLLLAHKANANQKDNSGATPLKVAKGTLGKPLPAKKRQEILSVIQLLKQSGAR